MALTQKTLKYRGRRHAAPDTDEHKQDKAIAEQRKAVTWVPIPTDSDEIDQASIPANPLGVGEQFKVINGELMPCSTEDFVAHLDHIQATRNWYIGSMRRKGEETKVRRKRPDVLEQVAVTLAPWQSLFLRITAGMEDGKYRPRVEKCYT